MTAKEYVESLQQKYGQLCQQDSNAMTTTRWASELYKLEARIEVYVLVLEDLEGVLRLMEDIPMADFVNNAFWYTVWDAKSGDLLASGTAAMCARRLGYASANSFASAVSHWLKDGSQHVKYTIQREYIPAVRWTAYRNAASTKSPPVLEHRRAARDDGFANHITPKDNTFSEEMQMDMISKKLANDRLYAYHGGRFWFWDEGRSIWKESHLLAKKYNLNHEYDKLLTPEDFLSDPSQFQALEDYEVDYILKNALQNAQPCQNAPIDPVEEPETAVVRATGTDVAEQFGNTPAAPSFDFGADDQTNALLLQDAQTFITGNMARIMAAKHAHDLTANHYKGSWGKWCAAVGISRDTGDRMVSVAAQCGNIQLEGKSIFDVQPMKLLYAAAKPSTPEEVKQAVFTGDITTYKEYQEALAQIKAEKDRANAAEAERDKLLGAQNRAAWAESHIQDVEAQRDAALADVQGLTEQNAKLQQSYHDADESRIAANLQRQKAEAERDRAEARAHKAEDALKHQPIAGVVDEEEVDRRAAEKAWGLADARNRELQEENDRLKKNSAQLERRMKAMTSRMDDLGQTDFETANHCPEAMLAIWNSCKGSYSRLTGEDLENTFQYICNTLNSIRQEAALLCRQPEGYDGGAA